MASPAVLSVRVSPSERSLLEAAAGGTKTTLSDFVRRTAVEAAELALLNRSVVTIPAKDWERFEAWLEQPPKDNPRLRALAARKPVWRD